MLILNGYTSANLVVKGSKFLAEITPIENQADAREKLKEFKTLYEDATHVVHAFISGLNAEVMGMSDDGEPSGTAGRPILDVMKGKNITNVILTVTRWFGGTLLGTGGLVKAYGDSAKLVLEKAFEQNLFEEYIAKSDFAFSVHYELYDKIKHSLKNFSLYNVKEEFDTNIKLSGQIKSTEFESLQQTLKNLSNGAIDL